MALAVLTLCALSLIIPRDFNLLKGGHYVFSVVLILLLGLLIIGDPGRIDREKRWLRTTTAIMISVITVMTAFSAVRLVVGILRNAAFASPDQLLVIGAIVWITNVIAFALWYWHLDRGGPPARANGDGTAPPAFRFPEEDIESLTSRGWYPQFVDYLALSFNTSTAFSATDVSAIRHWSKLWLMAESCLSLTILALVLARAINIL